jgi:simple sugar transport system ATP-binding protein
VDPRDDNAGIGNAPPHADEAAPEATIAPSSADSVPGDAPAAQAPAAPEELAESSPVLADAAAFAFAAGATSPAEPAETQKVGPPPLVAVRGLTRRFGQVFALDGIDLELRQGDVLALLGENGAGKTTLLNIFAGRDRADTGAIMVARSGKESAPLAPGSPSAAIKAGIALVDGGDTLAANLTALENIMLGRQSLWRPRLSRQSARRKVGELMARLDLRVELDVRVAELAADDRFGVKLLRALYRDVRVLLLDEPSGALTSQDAEALFQTLKRLADEGLAIVVATRKTDEAFALGGRIAVLRSGRKIAEAAATEEERAGVAAQIWTGAPPKSRPSFHAAGHTILELQNVDVTADEPRASLHRISLEVRAGDIIGIAGLAGSGQNTLSELIAGLVAPTGGEMRLFGRRLARFDAAAFVRAGIARIPQDRRRQGIVADMTIAENIVLEDVHREWFNRFGFLRFKTVHQHAREIVADHLLDCPRPELPASSLTDRQIDKLVLARALDRKPRLLVANQPTYALDGARAADVHRQIEIEREAGAAVLWISGDIEELLAHADAISVLHEGRLSVPQPTGAFDPRSLGHMMGGHGSLAQDWHGWGDGA